MDQLAPLEQRLRALGKIGAVLQIGAGYGLDVPALLSAGAGQIVLVEPEPGYQRYLAPLVGRHPEVSLVAAAAVPTAGQGETGRLHRFSRASLNSLSEGADLGRLFPGLEPREPLQVPLCGVQELAGKMQFDLPGAHVLILEVPGQALALLQAFEAQGVLEKFALVRVQEARGALYGAGMPEVMAFLGETGFDREPLSGGADPEFPVYSVRAGAGVSTQVSLRRYRALEAKVDAARSETKAMGGQLELAAKALEEAQAEHRSEADTLRKQLAEATEALDAAQTGRGAEVAALREQLAKAEAEASELRDKLTIAARARNQARSESERLAEERARLEEEVAGLRARDQQVREELVRTQGQIDMIRDLLLKGQGL